MGCEARADSRPARCTASSTELVHAAVALQADTDYSFFDSLILATALQSGTTTIYTEDLQHNQLTGGTLRIVNPFLNVAVQAESISIQ